ncbi:MAG: hypothetical protein GXY17_07470 [Clostridiaceae bacterium]|nr:hypothetical protein [Clostridiaceae bacterium]
MSVSGIGLNGYGSYNGYSGYGYAYGPANVSPVPIQTGVGGVAAPATATADIAGTGASGRMSGPGEMTGAGAAAGRTAGTADMQMLKRMGAIECETCKNRTYQDGSDDPGVSFKAPGHVDPASSWAVIRSHEQEHVMREQGKAKVEGRRVISQSVSLSTATCPECGRVYVAGGVTRTTTAAQRSNPAIESAEKKRAALASAYKGGKATTGRSVNKAV